MGEPVARKDGTDLVDTIHPSVGDAVPEDGSVCDKDPIVIGTDAGSVDVFVNGIGVVRNGDIVAIHTFPPDCDPHAPPLVGGSVSVFANGRKLARKGDAYDCGAKIIAGSLNVFAGG